MTTENGVMTMRKLPDGLEVPAGGSIALKPGSFHLMLMGLKQPLREGGTFHGTLTFDKAGPVDVEFEIEAMGATGAGDDEHTGGEGH
jgi:copper(I)-binding protein